MTQPTREELLAAIVEWHQADSAMVGSQIGLAKAQIAYDKAEQLRAIARAEIARRG